MQRLRWHSLRESESPCKLQTMCNNVFMTVECLTLGNVGHSFYYTKQANYSTPYKDMTTTTKAADWQALLLQAVEREVRYDINLSAYDYEDDVYYGDHQGVFRPDVVDLDFGHKAYRFEPNDFILWLDDPQGEGSEHEVEIPEALASALNRLLEREESIAVEEARTAWHEGEAEAETRAWLSLHYYH